MKTENKVQLPFQFKPTEIEYLKEIDLETRIKAKINHRLLWLIASCNKWHKSLNKDLPIPNPLKLEDFTPKILPKEEDKYCDILRFAIENPNSKNVALTGPYGSGKSTILKTFEDNNKEYKYLNISLATFDEKKEDINIEYCILKQLFYKVEHKKIPQSRFKRIVNQKKIGFKSMLFFGWLLSAVYFLNVIMVDGIRKFVSSLDFDCKIIWSFVIISVIFCLGLLGLTYKIMDFVLNFKLTSFKFNDAEVITDDDKKSVDFENEIDEILYFFERNPYTVVFIEDLDRFDNTEIFIKLREINFLLNNYEPIKEKRKITFIYAVQDDTFKVDERAKFFDFIIPVIPIINYTNSSKSLKEKIKWGEDEIDENFIKKVSRYLSDNRTIISIANEYKIYKRTLNKELDSTHLLAMMIYKNVEPTDFDNLKNEKGFVYTVFNDSESLIKSEIDAIEMQFKELQLKREKAINEVLQDVKELRGLYVLKFYEKLAFNQNENFKNININGNEYSIKQLIDESDNFDLFVKQTNISINYFNLSYGRIVQKDSSFSFGGLEKEVDSIKSYKKRYEIIENKSNAKQNEITKEIERLRNKKQKLNSKQLSELATDDYLKKCIESLTIYTETIENSNIRNSIEYKINNFNLIKFLLKNGHIDEKYYHYISFFYDGDITKSDHEYLLSFSNNNEFPFDYQLNEIESILTELSASDFERSQILNFDLLEFICYRRNQTELNLIVNFLNEVRGEYSMNFIFKYLEYKGKIKIRNNKGTFQPEYNLSTIKSVFMNALCKNWDTLWDYFVNNNIDNFANGDKLKLLHYIFIYVDIENIIKMDTQHSLSNFIANIESLLDLLITEDVDTNKIINFIETQNILFTQIDDKGNDKLFKYIYEKNHYELNIEMIALMVDKFNKNEIDINLLETENYTTILNTDLKNLKSYILDDLDNYLENVFLNLENNIHESEETIIKLLNNEDIDEKLKPKIIDKNQTLIKDISTIKDQSLWLQLIQKDKLAVNWENLLHYYKGVKEFDDILVNYLNIEEHYNVLKGKMIDSKFDKTTGENIVGGFSIDLINSKISINSFKNTVLYNSLPYLYENTKSNFENLSKEKMAVFIKKTNVFIFNKENYDFVKEKYNDLLIEFLEINKTEFIKEIDKYELDYTNIYKLLMSNQLTDIQKLAVYKTIGLADFDEDKNICIAVAKLLVDNPKTAIGDFGILKVILKNISNIVHKVVLFNLYSNEIPKGEVTEYIELLGEPYSDIMKGKQPKFDNFTYNRDFIERNLGGFISKIKEKNEKFIRVTTKKV